MAGIRWSEADLERFRQRKSAGDPLVPEKRSKYGATKEVVDGITFDSRAEAQFYTELKQCQQLGTVRYFLRQTPFDLPGNVRYRCDFMICYRDGSIQFVDVKGYVTKAFRRNKKQVEALYPVDIRCVKRQGGRFVDVEV